MVIQTIVTPRTGCANASTTREGTNATSVQKATSETPSLGKSTPASLAPAPMLTTELATGGRACALNSQATQSPPSAQNVLWAALAPGVRCAKMATSGIPMASTVLPGLARSAIATETSTQVPLATATGQLGNAFVASTTPQVSTVRPASPVFMEMLLCLET